MHCIEPLYTYRVHFDLQVHFHHDSKETSSHVVSQLNTCEKQPPHPPHPWTNPNSPRDWVFAVHNQGGLPVWPKLLSGFFVWTRKKYDSCIQKRFGWDRFKIFPTEESIENSLLISSSCLRVLENPIKGLGRENMTILYSGILRGSNFRHPFISGTLPDPSSSGGAPWPIIPCLLTDG